MSAAALICGLSAIDAGAPELRRLVAVHTADALACLAAGLRTREGAAIAAFYDCCDGSATLRASGAAAVIRFTECDAIHVPSCISPAAVAIPVALAFSPDPERYAAAVEAGFSIGLALGEAVGGVSALSAGIWPTLFAAPAIAAVTAGVAAGLPPATATEALGLAMVGHSGRLGRPGGMPSGRWLSIGEATLKGLRAVAAARAGFKGDASLLSSAWLEGQSGSGLARPARLEAPPLPACAIVGIKPFVAARQGSNAIEAFREILSRGVPADAIDRIRVRLPPVATGVVSRPLDGSDRLSLIAHLGIQFGFAAFEPARLLDVGRERPVAPQALALAAATEIAADLALDDGSLGSWPARVAVHGPGGWTESSCQRLPTDAGDPRLTGAVQDKIDRLTPDMAPLLREIMAGLSAGTPGALAEAARLVSRPPPLQVRPAGVDRTAASVSG